MSKHGFQNEAQLKSFLLEKCKSAVANAENKVYAIIKESLVKYYRDYDPILYDRTNQLLYSLVKSDVKILGNRVVAEVYFDIDGLNYMTGNMPTGEEVMAAASQGVHGAIGDNLLYRHGKSGVDVWNTPIIKIDAELIRILERELRAAGIPLKSV